MTIETLFTLKLSFFVLGFIIFLILETIYPNRIWTSKRYKRVTFHAALAIFNTILMRIPMLFILMPVLLIVTESQGGVFYDLGILKFILSFLILDIALYWWHRFNHTNQFLWKFHFVHHVDTHMDVGTSLRFHIGELFLSTLYKAIIIYLFGITLSEFLFYELLLVLSIQFHHSNIKLADQTESILSKVIVTPKYHTNHHTVKKNSREANYSSILTIWDRIFFTYKNADDDERNYLGLDDRSKEFGIINYFKHPLS